MATNFPSSFNENSCIKMVGYDMTKNAADKFFKKADLAQCADLSWQLSGLAGKRLVKRDEYSPQHNIGLGGAAVASLFRLRFAQPTQSRIHAVAASTIDEDSFKCGFYFQELRRGIEQGAAEFAKKLKGIYCFRITNTDGQEGIWVVDLKNGDGSCKFGVEPKGDVTISMVDDDFINLMSGKLNPQQAFFQGKLKLKGNMGLAMKLREFQINIEKGKL